MENKLKKIDLEEYITTETINNYDIVSSREIPNHIIAMKVNEIIDFINTDKNNILSEDEV